VSRSRSHPQSKETVMIYSTATVPVNPDGETPLTRAQAWAGLVIKARDARLPGGTEARPSRSRQRGANQADGTPSS
jgi:hypothetical protein